MNAQRFAQVLTIFAFGLGTVAIATTPVKAVEWTQVTENSVGDKFFIDASSIRMKADQVSFWHYRQFVEPNNPFLDIEVDQPVHGTVIRLSANCKTKTARVYRLNAYNKERKAIKRMDYGDSGQSITVKPGSSVASVLDYACTYKPSTKPAKPEAPEDSKTNGEAKEAQPR